MAKAKKSRIEVFPNVAQANVGKYVQSVVNDGAIEVLVTETSAGRYTIRATF